jgi:hypothetical protein
MESWAGAQHPETLSMPGSAALVRRGSWKWFFGWQGCQSMVAYESGM